MNLLIVDDNVPSRALRLTLTISNDDGTGALLRGDVALAELDEHEVFELLQSPPEERTVIVHSSSVRRRLRPFAASAPLAASTSPYASAAALLGAIDERDVTPSAG